MVSVSVQYNPAKIIFSWPSHPDAVSYSVYRKSKTSTSWGSPLTNLPANANSWEDVNINIGEAYEYQIAKTNSAYPYTGNGYVFAGIEYPATENKGTIILVIDSTYLPYLSAEINRLKIDMNCDGWRVLSHKVDRNDSVPDVKALIINDVNNNPDVRAVFLLGHVPVPYSGNLNPDGHSNHVGAWPADLYYGELNGIWTDQFINNTSASRPQNHNVPGDGKFDQSIIPSDVDLEVGRVDLFNMPAFALSDADLLKQYLDKNHNYRTGVHTAMPRGLVDDHFASYTEAFAANGWRNFSGMFGAANVVAADYFSTMTSNSYLWSYGCGGGTYNSAGGIGNTTNFATDSVQTIFTILFGSYFGDWDSQNNFIRAPLASASPALLCFWAGRPNWFFHHMALGDNIGYSTKLSQNNAALYNAGNSARNIHVALMGDPTLRMHVVKPSAALYATNFCDSVLLEWHPSPDTIAGYHLYAGDSLYGHFVRLNNSLIIDTFYVDQPAQYGKKFYIVRAMKLQTSGSGSYFNLSTGVIDSVVVYPQLAASISISNIKCFGNSDGIVDLTVSGGNPPYTYTWSNGTSAQDLVNVPAGKYYFTVADNSNCYLTDSVVLTEPPQLILSMASNPDIGNNCIGEAISNITGGVSPYTYQWDDPAQQTTAVASGLCEGWYAVIITDSNSCVITDSIFVENQAGVSVNGMVYYDNYQNTPMTGVYMDLSDSLGVIAYSDTTDQNGDFSFANVQQGNYSMVASTSKAWGGVNSTDALAIMYHFVGLNFLTGMKLIAADVSYNGYINSSDALYVQQRYIGMVNAFPSGDYAFENKNINVTTTNITENLASICYGDVNASYAPSSKNNDQSIQLIRKDTLYAAATGEVEIPLISRNDLAVSAISLSLLYSEDLLIIDDIHLINSDGSDLLWNAKDGKLAISWYDILPLRIEAGDTLLNLRCRLKKQSEDIGIVLLENSEFADEGAVPCRNSVIIIPHIKFVEEKSNPDIFITSLYPNPFKDHTILEYSITRAGKVECMIYDSEGRYLETIFSCSHSFPGSYNFLISGKELSAGINFCRLIYTSDSKRKSMLFRLIVNK